MTELRNVEADLSRFRARVLAASVIVLVCFLLLGARLVWLQVVRHEDLDEQAEANRTAIVPIVPNRGLILDRNGIVLASNYSAYTLEIQPSRVDRPLDTLSLPAHWTLQKSTRVGQIFAGLYRSIYEQPYALTTDG